MPTDSQYILESIGQGCVMLAEDEFVIDRLVKYFGNGRIRWHVEFRGHRIELTTGQLKKQYLTQEGTGTGCCAATSAFRAQLQAMGTRYEEECRRASLAG